MPTYKDIESAMQHCIEIAISNIEKNGQPFSALVLTNDLRLISEATNCVSENHDPTAHAEISAIRLACRSLKKPTLLKEFILVSTCEPCRMCAAAIHQSNIGNVVFGASLRDLPLGGFRKPRPFDSMRFYRARNISMIRGVERIRSLYALNLYRIKNMPER